MVENWKTIDDAPLYEVSNQGRVRNRMTGRILIPTDNGRGYPIVGLRDQGARKVRSLATLVAKAFLKDPLGDLNNSPLHKDGDRRNCSANNLVWRPRWFVAKRTKEIKNGPSDLRPVRDLLTGKVYLNAFEAAQEFAGLEESIIWACYDQWQRTVHGRSWQFAYDVMEGRNN